MGANGAGKSTLVKILTGAISANGGRILLRGEARDVRSPAEARKAGLVPVYQEPSLIPDLDVLSNLRLTQTPVEPFRELGARARRARPRPARHRARRSAGHPARARPGARACRGTRRAAARRDDGGAARQPRRARARRGAPPGPGRPVRHLHFASLHRDFSGLRPRNGAARRRDRRRGRRRRRRRGTHRRADARRQGREAAHGAAQGEPKPLRPPPAARASRSATSASAPSSRTSLST